MAKRVDLESSHHRQVAVWIDTYINSPSGRSVHRVTCTKSSQRVHLKHTRSCATCLAVKKADVPFSAHCSLGSLHLNPFALLPREEAEGTSDSRESLGRLTLAKHQDRVIRIPGSQPGWEESTSLLLCWVCRKVGRTRVGGASVGGHVFIGGRV